MMSPAVKTEKDSSGAIALWLFICAASVFAMALIGAVTREGATIVPLQIHFNDRGRAKVLLGLAEGRRKVDKRAVIKERDWQRDKARIMRARG